MRIWMAFVAKTVLKSFVNQIHFSQNKRFKNVKNIK